MAIARLFGYARVSTDDQTTALQRDALTAANVDELFEEFASGADRSRPILGRLLASLEPGDTLVIWRLDRLGRSLSHLLEIAEDLNRRGIHLRSLNDGFDTATSAGRLLYSILGAVGEFERALTQERTRAALAACKRRGEKLGRPFALKPSQVAAARKMLADGEMPGHVAHLFGVNRSTVFRALQRSK